MNLQYYKQNVSIIQLVESLGYTYNPNKGRHPKQYEHPNGDKVIINDKINPLMEVYFTRNNYDDNGTVVDFVKNRLSMFNVHYDSEWEGVIKVLSEFVGHPYKSPRMATKPVENSNELRKSFNVRDFVINNPSINDLTYLRFDRKLSHETLKTFLPYIRIVREKGKRFQNIGFPYIIPNQNGFVRDSVLLGFEIVNHEFRGHVKGSHRREAVWVADLANAPQLVSKIYVGESAIDVMSFYQLYKNKYNFENAVFISTGGSVLKNQVLNVLKAYPRAKIHTLFDNDFSGKMYDIYLAAINVDKNITMRKKEESVLFDMKKGTFEIPMDQISLARFERITGIRSSVRAHKARGKDFNEMLQHQTKEKEELNTTNKRKR